MREVEAIMMVRALLTEFQAESKAKLEGGLVNTVFKVRDQVMLRTKELLNAAVTGKLRPRWDGRSCTHTLWLCHAKCGVAPLTTQ
jgi:hypothetical protein